MKTYLHKPWNNARHLIFLKQSLRHILILLLRTIIVEINSSSLLSHTFPTQNNLHSKIQILLIHTMSFDFLCSLIKTQQRVKNAADVRCNIHAFLILNDLLYNICYKLYMCLLHRNENHGYITTYIKWCKDNETLSQ